MSALRPCRATFIRWSCILLFTLALVGCSRDAYFRLIGYDRASLLNKFTPQDDVSLALRSADLLRQGRLDQVEDMLDPSIRNSGTHDTLSKIRNLFPSEDPATIKPVQESFVRGRDGSTTSVTLEYEFAPQITSTTGPTELIPRSWLLTQVVVQTNGGAKRIRGFHAMPIAMSYEEMNEFTLADKGISQYTALCLAVGASGFTLGIFVLCIRTKIGKIKWFWLALILIGFLRLTLNWTTGQWSFTLLAVQVPPVSVSVQPYGPWTIVITAPVGAFAFLLFRKRRTSEVVALPSVQSPTLRGMTDASR